MHICASAPYSELGEILARIDMLWPPSLEAAELEYVWFVDSFAMVLRY